MRRFLLVLGLLGAAGAALRWFVEIYVEMEPWTAPVARPTD